DQEAELKKDEQSEHHLARRVRRRSAVGLLGHGSPRVSEPERQRGFSGCSSLGAGADFYIGLRNTSMIARWPSMRTCIWRSCFQPTLWTAGRSALASATIKTALPPGRKTRSISLTLSR